VEVVKRGQLTRGRRKKGGRRSIEQIGVVVVVFEGPRGYRCCCCCFWVVVGFVVEAMVVIVVVVLRCA